MLWRKKMSEEELKAMNEITKEQDEQQKRLVERSDELEFMERLIKIQLGRTSIEPEKYEYLPATLKLELLLSFFAYRNKAA